MLLMFMDLQKNSYLTNFGKIPKTFMYSKKFIVSTHIMLKGSAKHTFVLKIMLDFIIFHKFRNILFENMKIQFKRFSIFMYVFSKCIKVKFCS